MHGDGNPGHYQTLRHQPDHSAPRARDFKAEVAKLIDVSSCVGCKACQVACSEWNDIRDEVGTASGCTTTPPI
jgi:Fe-S-cluster-containing dehydrogenase component